MLDPASVLKGRTRETKIRRDAAGLWFNGEDKITHLLVSRAFDRWLVPAPDGSGRWCLSNDINWAYIELEGPPRFVRSVSLGDPVTLTLSDGAEVPLDIETLRHGPDDALYCDVPGGMVARFDRAAAVSLADLLGEDEQGVFLEVGSSIVRPPHVQNPLDPMAAP